MVLQLCVVGWAVLTPDSEVGLTHKTAQSLAVVIDVHEAKLVVVMAVMSQPETVFVEVVQEAIGWPLRPGALVVKQLTKRSSVTEDFVHDVEEAVA